MAEHLPMQGKTCVVTGASDGIGLITAESLVRSGARVLAFGHHRQRSEIARRRLEQAARPGVPVPEMVLADLGTLAGVRRAGEAILARCPTIDLLVNNAGAVFVHVAANADGIERTFALNHLGYFLLTALVHERLLAAAPARIVNVASTAHRRGSNDFEAFVRVHRFGGRRAYQTSKLANVIFSAELARRLDGSGVSSNSLHPGLVATGFGRTNPWPLGPAVRIAMRFAGAISPEAGAKTSIYLATSPEVEGVSGRYFVECREAAVAPTALDGGVGERLWALSERLTGHRFDPAVG
jgi:NAD(P)-dependent dehydrogenase (short-subunit alcohol dehydrogenase family)